MTAGVGDQGFLGGQLQLELVSQQCRQLVLDALGFGPRSGKAKEMIIGVAGVAQPPVAGITGITGWQLA